MTTNGRPLSFTAESNAEAEIAQYGSDNAWNVNMNNGNVNNDNKDNNNYVRAVAATGGADSETARAA